MSNLSLPSAGVVSQFSRAWRGLAGLAAFLALVAAGQGLLLRPALDSGLGGAASLPPILAVLGAAVGALLAARQYVLHQALGLVPIAATLLAGALAWGALGGPPTWTCLLVGLAAGIAAGPLRRSWLAALPADGRVARTVGLSAAFLAPALLFPVTLLLMPAGPTELGAVAGLATVFAAAAGYLQFRGVVEQVASMILSLTSRVRAHGPGLAAFPKAGPVVISNHAAYLDACWMMMAMPRPLTPMMLSLYYDVPGWRWLMSHVLGVIRVVWSNYRREAPELNEAVKALDRGECLLIFPEGWLARRPEHLRRFGQGVWRILRARPNTPVVCCWIEGSWGSFTSHAGGPPLKNKRPDFLRPIDIGMSAPVVLDPAVLQDGAATRTLLMRLCAAARAHVGGEPVPVGETVEECEAASGSPT